MDFEKVRCVVRQRCSTPGHWQSSKGSKVVLVGGCICVS
jgi:hypothetical protein